MIIIVKNLQKTNNGLLGQMEEVINIYLACHTYGLTTITG